MSKDLQQFMENTPCTLPTSWYIASPYSHEAPEIKIQREADAKRAESSSMKITRVSGHTHPSQRLRRKSGGRLSARKAGISTTLRCLTKRTD